jgi:hypothetical protein
LPETAAALSAAAAFAAAILADVFLSQNEIKATPPIRASAGSLKSQTGSMKMSCRKGGSLLDTAGYNQSEMRRPCGDLPKPSVSTK